MGASRLRRFIWNHLGPDEVHIALAQGVLHASQLEELASSHLLKSLLLQGMLCPIYVQGRSRGQATRATSIQDHQGGNAEAHGTSLQQKWTSTPAAGALGRDLRTLGCDKDSTTSTSSCTLPGSLQVN